MSRSGARKSPLSRVRRPADTVNAKFLSGAAAGLSIAAATSGPSPTEAPPSATERPPKGANGICARAEPANKKAAAQTKAAAFRGGGGIPRIRGSSVRCPGALTLKNADAMFRPVLQEAHCRISETNIRASSAVSYTHLRAHETRHDLVCRLL